MDLHGKVALVTGAGSGIGRALALGFGAAGATVAACDVRHEAAEETAGALRAQGGKALAVTVDVSDEESVDRMVEAVLGNAGRVDVLANIAGVYVRNTVADMEAAEWDRVMGINLRGVFLCSRAVLRRAMLQVRSGAILNIVSGLALIGSARGSHYAASKAGVIALTKSLAAEVAAHGVRVNAIGPGVTDTPLARGANSEEELERAARATVLGRMGRPEEVVPTALFLCSDDAAGVTGQVWFLR